jgi:hypothetical protein
LRIWRRRSSHRRIRTLDEIEPVGGTVATLMRVMGQSTSEAYQTYLRTTIVKMKNSSE